MGWGVSPTIKKSGGGGEKNWPNMDLMDEGNKTYRT
jgi:hypothetical protein